jgi:hypothetical protein
METMFSSIPCKLCNNTGHRLGKCPELWQNNVPPPQKGGHDHDEDHLGRRKVTNSGNEVAHDFNQTIGSKAGHWKPLSVINM